MCPTNKTPIIEFLVEQKIDDNGWNYSPYRLRDDKNVPNGKITWENTLKNIRENLKIEDFVNIYLGIKRRKSRFQYDKPSYLSITLFS